jgi:hypothetical protein
MDEKKPPANWRFYVIRKNAMINLMRKYRYLWFL